MKKTRLGIFITSIFAIIFISYITIQNQLDFQKNSVVDAFVSEKTETVIIHERINEDGKTIEKRTTALDENGVIISEEIIEYGK